MKRLALLLLAAGMCGCDNPATVAKKSRNELREYQEARSERDYERAIALIKRANDQTFQAIDEAKQWKALAESLPLVVTNECTGKHWSYIVEPDPAVPLPRCEPLRWSTNGYWYAPVTNAVEK